MKNLQSIRHASIRREGLLVSGDAAAVLVRLQKQRSSVVQGFLWVLFGLVSGSLIINAILLGPRVLTLADSGPNLAFAGLIITALWLNRRQHFRVAAWLITGVTLLLGVAAVVVAGLAGDTADLIFLFIPLILAGLLLNRFGLWLIVSLTLLAVLAAPVLHGAEVAVAGGSSLGSGWNVALEFAIVYAIAAFLLDRFGLALYDTLRKAAGQETQLNEKTIENLRTKQELVERQNLSEAIIENLPGIFYVLDESGSYLQWNRNFPDTIGYTQEEMGQVSPVDLFEGEEGDLVAQRITDVFEHGYTTVEASLVTKDGRRIPYFFNGTRVTLGGKPYLAGIGIDRSEIDAANRRVHALNGELVERLERLRALREIDMAITGNLDLGPALDVILEQVTSRLRVDAAAILLFGPETQSLRFGASRGFRTSPKFVTELRLGQGLAGRAGLQREVIVLNDADEFAREFIRYGEIRDEGIASYVAIPLVSKGQLQGILELFHRSALDSGGDWRDFMMMLATQAALALDNGAMFEGLQRSNTELRLAYDTTIEGWGRALDLRDEETAGHSVRVTDLTLLLARRMGVLEEELVHMRRGALLHDIGKMGVPDSILLKPDRLTGEEWAVMQQHATIAYDFLAPIPFLKQALDIPYCHHEKWDGTGYPRGLKGEEIPLSARIFAVVDVYDALTSDRPYREAWTPERALSYVQEQAGAHFDPLVVQVFLDLVQNTGPEGSVPSGPAGENV